LKFHLFALLKSCISCNGIFGGSGFFILNSLFSTIFAQQKINNAKDDVKENKINGRLRNFFIGQTTYYWDPMCFSRLTILNWGFLVGNTPDFRP